MRHSVRNLGRLSAVTLMATIAMSTSLGPARARVAASAAVPASQGSQGETDPKAIIGSWLETVTFPPESGRPALKSLSSYHDDHTTVCSDQGNVTTAGDQPAVFSACHGAWTHVEKRKFASTVVELISDLSGNLVGYLRVRSMLTVSQSGDTYTGSSLAEILDPDGNVLFEVPVTNAGRRIHVQLP